MFSRRTASALVAAGGVVIFFGFLALRPRSEVKPPFGSADQAKVAPSPAISSPPQGNHGGIWAGRAHTFPHHRGVRVPCCEADPGRGSKCRPRPRGAAA